MLIVGEVEQSKKTVSVRKHGEGDLGVCSVEEFAERLKKEMNNN